MTLVLLCSGQGRQDETMFGLTGDAPAAAPLFAQATTLLGGRDPRDIVRDGDGAGLHRNRAGQVLCVLQALAAAAVLRDALPDRLIVAGYSVGELAAWGVAGFLSGEDTLTLAAGRAEAMDAAAAPGSGLVFIRGLARATIDDLCARHGAAVAIVNPDDAFVVGGTTTALESLAAAAQAMHARRIVHLPIEVASHTPQLAPASAAFRDQLRRVAIRRQPDSTTRLLSGIDGSPVFGIEAGLDKLAAQVSQTVQWAECLGSSVESGATAFLELGPGSALSHMVAEGWPAQPARALDAFRSIDGVRAWLGRIDIAAHSR